MQDALAILISLGAAAFLSRRAWLHIARRRAGACGTCSHCAAADQLETRSLVTLSASFPRDKPPGRSEA